jgi:glutaminyl-tRNA synthetase
MQVMSFARVEQAGADILPGQRFQFLRQGYFVADDDSRSGALLFNQIVGLKDSYKPEN